VSGLFPITIGTLRIPSGTTPSTKNLWILGTRLVGGLNVPNTTPSLAAASFEEHDTEPELAWTKQSSRRVRNIHT
jgi:hypothetical protein